MSKRTTDPRSERILVNTTPEIKEQLQQLAQARDLSLSLLCHEILIDWLRQEQIKGGEGR